MPDCLRWRFGMAIGIGILTTLWQKLHSIWVEMKIRGFALNFLLV